MSSADVAKLAESLRAAARAYYDSFEPLMSDAEYDAGLERLRIAIARDPSLESKFVDLLDTVSGGQSAGGDVEHPSLMGSMYKARTLDAVDELVARVNGPVVVEPKLDGLAIRAVYETGNLVLVATRGDGYTGEDITDQAIAVEILPTAARMESVELRGEVFIRDEDFRRANALRKESGDTPFVNQRNAAAGILRKGDPAYAGLLSFAAYEIESENVELATKELGISVTSTIEPQLGTAMSDSRAVRRSIARLVELRDGLGYPIDGAVIKAVDPKDRDRLGMGSKAPKWAIAYKYDAEEADTKVRDIHTSVGRTGRLSIQVEIEPVFVGGTTIRFVSGHNVTWMLNRDIRIGDTVTVSRAGDVIPYLGQVDLEKRTSDAVQWQPPETDPVGREWDKTTLLWRSSSPELTVLPLIEYALGRDALDVENIGSEIAASLVDTSLVKDIADIFDLTHDQLASLRLNSGRVVGEKVSAKILSEIEQAKSARWNRIITALGIRAVGRVMGLRLASAFPTMGRLRGATLEDLAGVEGVGKKKASLIREGLDDLEVRGIFHRLKSAGVNTGDESSGEQTSSKPLEGETVVVSGKVGTLTRTEATERIQSLGGQATSSVSASTTLLVAREGSTSSKANKARDLNIRVMSPEDFLSL